MKNISKIKCLVSSALHATQQIICTFGELSFEPVYDALIEKSSYLLNGQVFSLCLTCLTLLATVDPYLFFYRMLVIVVGEAKLASDDLRKLSSHCQLKAFIPFDKGNSSFNLLLKA